MLRVRHLLGDRAPEGVQAAAGEVAHQAAAERAGGVDDPRRLLARVSVGGAHHRRGDRLAHFGSFSFWPVLTRPSVEMMARLASRMSFQADALP